VTADARAERDGLDLSSPRRVHIVGIGGAGMSAIATVLARMGHHVTGSDLKESRGLERLRLLGIRADVGHNAANIADADAVVVSTAIPASNPEVRAAGESGVPVLRRADALRALAATRRTVAVAGSHGKTTTSSMLALILRAAGWRPSFIIGGDLNEVGTNAAYDEGEWLVVEADESDGTFLELSPEAGMVANVEPDHLDHYGGFAGLVAAFDRFLAAIAGPRVACFDDPIASRLARDHGRTVTYGFEDGATYRIVAYEGDRNGSRFRVQRGGRELGTIDLPVPGRHNASNAAGAAAMALELGAPFESVVEALRGFGGVARRFQFRGEVDGVTLVDDYAHIPGEIAAMVSAAREGGWGRVIVVFQPHRYTRTARLWRDFADAFTGADLVVLTDVYAANETPQPGVSGRLILGAVLEAHPALPVVYLPRRADVVQHALLLARPGDVVLTLGAGDLTTVPDEWLTRAAS
jgi:UDP-N-acetylmuramate--alanine ligase